MIKGEKVRFDIYRILYSVFKFNKTLNNIEIKKIIKKHTKKDISFLNNVTLNSMRFHLHALKIINKYIKKKLRDKEKILLISAVTQIVFLNFKEYAVINCSVEIAKKLKIYHGFINAVLKKVSENKEELRSTNIEFNDLPKWFKIKTVSLTKKEKRIFLNNFKMEPSIHIVFKNEKKLEEFDEDLIKTSSISGFLVNRYDIVEIKSYSYGEWWIQDFSSFFPLHNLLVKNYNNKKFLDACSAPGGKAFQILSKNNQLVLNDQNKERIKVLNENLKRLKFKTKVLNEDFSKFPLKEKFDFIIIDAPCSSVGTIRKNPEIFFKNSSPDFENLKKIQEKLIKKASKLLNKEGYILYMTCSFLKYETIDQIDKFLEKNCDFELYNFKLRKEFDKYSKLVRGGLMITLPDKILDHGIDGYFAACLKKNK